MKTFIGIDLGSTTTKAIVIDEDRNVLGRGITNSRSNYDTAAAIAKQEALVNARFYLFRAALSASNAAKRANFDTVRCGSSDQNAACSTSIGRTLSRSAACLADCHNSRSEARDASG